MNITRMARQLLAISNDLRSRRPNAGMDGFEDGYLCDFDQLWGSTALGFPGCGGSAMTCERTYVFIPHNSDRAFVYFGDQFAYECGINDEFWYDVDNKQMAKVMEKNRYEKA